MRKALQLHFIKWYALLQRLCSARYWVCVCVSGFGSDMNESQGKNIKVKVGSYGAQCPQYVSGSSFTTASINIEVFNDFLQSFNPTGIMIGIPFFPGLRFYLKISSELLQSSFSCSVRSLWNKFTELIVLNLSFVHWKSFKSQFIYTSVKPENTSCKAKCCSF